MKKLLALVLAMVMAFSLMLSASAVDYKDYSDKDQITPQFTEAVQVLTGLQVFKGDEAGSFNPGQSITRASVAAIIYRMVTGDVTDSRVNIYADYGNFVDVKSSDWFAGYVGYCANAEYIKGHNGYFRPNDTVTGYEALAMILRAVGYDQNHEFEGAAWQTRVAHLAQELKITENVKNANFENTLSVAARRDVVADLLFQTAVTVPTVTYTSALQYNDRDQVLGGNKNPTLGQKTFGLYVDWQTGWTEIDKWGTPGYYWAKGGTLYDYNGTAGLPRYWKTVTTSKSSPSYNLVATITPDATKTYDTAGVHECDVAHDLDISNSQLFKLYVNSNTPITSAYNIVATDTVTRVGGQGRESKFWYKVKSPFVGTMDPWCTMVDTYLATVTKVTDRVLDPAGHVIVPAYLYLDVYDGHGVGTVDKTTGYAVIGTGASNTSEHRAEKDDANWEYVKGDKVLIKGYTDYKQADTDGSNNSGLNHQTPTATTNSVEANNKAAFETNRLLPNVGNNDKRINVVKKAEPVLGKQTVTYWNTGKHTVDGKDYSDQMTLFLDVAGTKTNTTYAWYFDTKGNLIGIDYVPDTVNYGVITSIYSALDQGDSATSGTAKAIANVLYADGTEGTITIDRFLMTQKTSSNEHGTPDTKLVDTSNAPTTWATAEETVELLPVYDNTGANVMTSTERKPTTANNAKQAGWLHVAPVIAVNAVENGVNGGTNKYYGILRGNMFKFVASADGNMTAIEVAGKKDTAHTGENDGVYEWNYNATPTAGKIYKNFAYVALDTGSPAGDIWMDSDTRIMVRGWDTSKSTATNTVNCYTLATLPGDVNFANREIDWADPDGDGRADYIYVTGTVEGTITYGLFYYNGGAAQWNGVDKKGTAFGWLNGEPTTVEFNNEVQFNLIKNSSIYKGHLFGLQLTNNVVSNVMACGDNTTHEEYILNDEAASWAAETAFKVSAIELATTYATGNIGVTGHSGGFGLGSANIKNGNPYTANTEVVYVEDVAAPSAATDTCVAYDQSTGTITTWTDTTVNGKYDSATESVSLKTYHLVPGSKVVGLGMTVTQDSAILDYLNKTHNDVTIVYEEDTVWSIVEIYVATDPDVTPGKVVGATKPVSGVTKVAGSAWKNALKAALPGEVVYATSYDSDISDFDSSVNDATKTSKVLWFPYTAIKDQTYTLAVYDSNGTRVFGEGKKATAAGTNVLYFNFTVNTNPDGDQSGLPMKAGTYTFQITTVNANSETVVVSAGSFTME